jgi:SPP1 gp7 family putative phage head morphogenesis protein
MVAGETTQDIIDALIGTKRLRYKDGARQMSRYGLGTLVRTATNFAANVGRQSTWEENDDVIKSVRWVSTLDTRTTPICRSRDGMVFPVDSGPRPPAHPNCRSTTVAVTKSWRELGIDSDELDEGTRASMNGQVPASMTYYQWLSKQSASIQREVLGDSRYDLWKIGGIAPEKFVNDAGKSLTLDQLKSLYPDAFKDAGV